MIPAIHHNHAAVPNLQCWHSRCRLQIMSAHSTRPLQTTILRSVSRSFYLSIRLLPAQLREPIALAYLLARATDSVADTAGISGLVRIEALKMLSDGIQGKASRYFVGHLNASFLPLQVHESE